MESPNSIEIFGRRISKSQIVFVVQVIIIYMIIITCLFNLTFHNGENQLWTALLSSSIGYILPAPRLKK
jgi:Trk-type K+ transport system membrane component